MNYIVFICIFFIVSCSGLFSDLEKQWSSFSSSSDTVRAVCSDQCESYCRDVFSFSDHYEKCVDLGYSSAQKVESVYSRMEKGNWSSITSEELDVLVDISIEPWLRQARSFHASAKEMLLWIAKNKDIARLLDDEGSILKEGLGSVSYKRNVRGLKEGLSLQLEDGKRFLEVMAWERNDEGLKKMHQLILNVCGNRDGCIEDVYCTYKDEDIVFESITDLELHSDFSDVDVFHSGLCS